MRGLSLALGLIATLALVIYLLNVSGTRTTSTPSYESENIEPGFAALDAELIETGEDGQPLYRLDATRIDQRIPGPNGDAVLTEPRLTYEPARGNPWSLRAQHGLLPPGARYADLTGAVEVAGRPEGSKSIMYIHAEELDIDMTRKIVTSPVRVTVDWAGSRLVGIGLYANMQTDELRLKSSVHGRLAH